MSQSNDLESHSWPGFVDILSAAIMMFVFFVLITALALFIQVITYTSKEDPQALVDASQDKISELEVENRELRESLAGLEQKIKETDAAFSESNEDQRIVIGEDGMSMFVFFGPTSITLTEETDAAVKSFAADVIARFGANRLRLTLNGAKTISPIDTIARKIVVARMFNIRNAFLEGDLPRDEIRMEIVEPSSVEDSYDWTYLEFQPR